MLIGHRDFPKVVVADSGFRQPNGEGPLPKVVVAYELVSGCTYRMFGDDLLSRQHPPYPIGPDCLFVAFHAPAEISVHHVLGWEDPKNVLDLHVEFRNFTNGRYLPSGHSLIGALVYCGLEAMNPAETTKKEEGRELAMSDRTHTAEEWQRLVDYCQSDVDRTCRLLRYLLPHIDIDRALLRGRYMVAAAHIEGAGIPTDTEALTRLGQHWDGVRLNLIQQVNTDYGGIFDGLTLKADDWERWTEDHRIPWPRLPTDYLGRNRLAMDEDTFRERARIYPAVTPIHELRKMLGKMRVNSLTVGADGRNRTGLWPFTARTGRNQPRSSEHIMGPSVWLRGLIRAEPGNAVVCIDYNQQEFGIAGGLSGDPAMIQAYHSGDPYLAFAKQAGAAPPNATKASHGAIRDQFKTCALGTLYSMGANTLAERTGLYIPYAADLLRLHRKTYPQFWKWSNRVVDYALLHNHLFTTFGWNLFLEGEPNPNSLRNFPMQANGAEMLRLACCLAVERGVKVIAPVHDALLIEARGGDLVGAVVTTRRAMAEASAIVLGGMTLGTEFAVYRYPLRYMDEKRGRKMWNMVFRIIKELEAGK